MRSSRSSQPQKSPVLPLPEVVASHHLETLLPWAQSWREQDRVPPVLLLTGIEGVGKRSMAYHLAQWLLCERAGFSRSAEVFSGGLFGDVVPEAPATDGPCGECGACRKALQGSWVAFREIGSSEDSGSSESEDPSGAAEAARLKIDDFRELRASAGFAAEEGSYRIFLIRNAERMTPQAANSLLKLLEEPPRGWVFILTAGDASLLLPTLVSRCQRIRLRPFTEQELRKLLPSDPQSERSERLELAIRLAQGSWKRALELSEGTGWERRETVLRFLENPPEHLNSVLEWSSSGSEGIQQLIDLLEPLQLELLRWSSQPEAPSSGLDRTLAAHLKYVGIHLRARTEVHRFWLDRAERLARARQEATLPLNKKLLAQEILLPYLLS
jgi:DNA polymerase-3 subunit delta'